MESDLDQHHNVHHQKQTNSSLTRYKSAPSSYYSTLMDRKFCEQFFNRPSSPETEQIFARFMSTSDDSQCNLPEDEQKSNIGNYGDLLHRVVYQKPVLEEKGLNSEIEGSFSILTNRSPELPMKTNCGGNSSLIRQSSSPAGCFSNVNIDNGYGGLRGGGNFGAGNSTNEEPSFLSSRLMSPIPEIEDKSHAGLPISCWDDPTVFSDDINGEEGLGDDDEKAFGDDDEKNAGSENRLPKLAHHLSLPNTLAEMRSIDKFLQFSDSVPCKLRAKRGCATHPRSIAERVRRTKISERMRKLQDLVPNMDKQTNTSDMLDLAVEYIKDLQKQVQTLADDRARCRCSTKQQQ